jgi:hypothetical protein
LLKLLEKQRQAVRRRLGKPLGGRHRQARPSRRPPPGTTPTQLGAYTVVARVLLNLDETITKE